MAVAVTPTVPPSREEIQRHATRLRERILKGECPYPDAALEANEAFLGQLREDAGSTVAELSLKHSKERDRLGGWQTGLAAAGVVGALAVGIFAANCPPVAAHALAATSGAVGVRILFRLAGRQSELARVHERFTRQLDAWSQYDSDKAPKVPAWKGPMKVSNIDFLTRTFVEDLKGFPYAAELTGEHQKLMGAMKEYADRPVADAKAELLAAARRPSPRVARIAAGAGRLLANAGWVGGVAALAAGQPWLALGLAGAMVGGFGLRLFAERRMDAAPDALRAARSLHYWEEAMAAVPPTTAGDLLFGKPKPEEAPPPEAVTIEPSQEDVRIGKVVVPVKGSRP